MFENILEALRKRIGDRAVVLLLISGFIVTLVWLLYTFLIGQNQSERDAYYGQMLAVCEEVSKTVGQIATAGLDDDLKAPVAAFEALKFGEVRLFESKELERAMVLFRSLLDDPPAELSAVISPAGVQRGLQKDRMHVRVAAVAVTNACRQMIQPSFLDQILSLLSVPPPDSGQGVQPGPPSPNSH